MDTQKNSLHIGMRKVKSLLAIMIGFLIWQALRGTFNTLRTFIITSIVSPSPQSTLR